MGSSKLALDPGIVESCRAAAARIAADVAEQTAGMTTVSVERTVARLFGVDGANDLGAPLPNVLVEHVRSAAALAGASPTGSPTDCSTPRPLGTRPPGRTLRQSPTPSRRAAWTSARCHSRPRARSASAPSRSSRAAGDISRRMDARRALRERLGESPPPLRYVLTATGNVYEDVVHGLAVAEAGGDIVAVIRSTAQSLLDYVPFGPTTEGYGGTFATQANFAIMRAALDEWSEHNGRYVRLSSFCSGLCMSEIAAMGAFEGLDNMVNDALYGILYRDINPVRGLLDQRVSRTVNGYFGVVINTGEDNYLRTADALEAAPSVTASQFINHQLARDSGCPTSRSRSGTPSRSTPP